MDKVSSDSASLGSNPSPPATENPANQGFLHPGHIGQDGTESARAPHESRHSNISDHALVRYIERVRGESLESYREEIAALIDGKTAVPGWQIEPGFDDGLLFIIEMSGDVVTVLPPSYRPKRGRKWDTRRFIQTPAPSRKRSGSGL